MSHRMSRISTAARNLIVRSIESVAKSPPSSPQPGGTAYKATFLNERLGGFGLSSVEMDPDGNCQVGRQPNPNPSEPVRSRTRSPTLAWFESRY